jgi:hypothetical protein
VDSKALCACVHFSDFISFNFIIFVSFDSSISKGSLFSPTDDNIDNETPNDKYLLNATVKDAGVDIAKQSTHLFLPNLTSNHYGSLEKLTL